jgi:RimJ/RimL family protein N-acetyltransferase
MSTATLVVRPLDAADRDRLAAAFARLSFASRRSRFLAPKKRLTPTELHALVELDHVEREALAAIDPSRDRIVAVARYAAHPGAGDTADVAVTTAEDRRGEGLASDLLARLIERARINGLRALTATIEGTNGPCRRLLARHGFRRTDAACGLVELRLEL